MKLLYRTAEWHGLAKARMHTESSLTLLETLTTEFGQLIRQFRDLTCSAFNTVELPGEVAARNRRKKPTQSGIDPHPITATPNSTTASTQAPVAQPAIPNGPLQSSATISSNNATQSNPTTPGSTRATHAEDTSRRTKVLNLLLYKLHALGDYVACIRMFGTTDSYSTQLVSNSPQKSSF